MTFIPNENYNYKVALGKVSGAVTWNKFGYNDDVDTGDAEVIWSVGGAFTRLTTASTLQVVSTSASDTSAGTGARSVIIYGINGSYTAVTEVVTLNGITPVATTNSYLGVNRVAIYLSGSGGKNAGAINVTATTGGSTQAQIPLGEGTTQQAFFFTQANKTALLDWLVINCNKLSGSSPKVTIRGWVVSQVSGSRYEVFRHLLDTSIRNTIEYRPSQPFIVGEKSLIYFEASTDTNNTVITLRFSLIETNA